MVTITIEPKPVPMEFTDLINPLPELNEIRCKGEVPAHLFERLIESGAEWYLDLSHASDEEAINWAFDDVHAKCLKAFREEKIVFLAGVPISEDEIYEQLWRFMQECKEVPDIQCFSDLSISVGSSHVHTEDFWPEFMD